jgi:putative ABC transport system permease protein
VTYWTLVRRTVGRNPFRTTLTLLGVAVAVIAFVALRTVLDAWSVGAEYAAKDRLLTRHKVSYGLPLPKRYVEDIATRVPGVQKVTFCDWFGGRWAKAPNEFFANVACAADAFEVYPEIAVAPEALAAWKRDKQGAILGDVLAQKLGVRVGDRMTLQGSFYPGDWELRIVGIYTAPPQSAVDRSTLFFRWDYKNERVPERQRDLIGWVFTRVDDPASSASVSRAIDALFDEREVRTATMSERAANGTLLGGVSAILSALDIVSILVLTIMTLILGNTIAMGVREQTTEYGVMLVLGFEPRHVRLLVVAEAVSLSVCGGLLGLVLAYPLVQLGLGQWLEVNIGQFFPAFRIAPRTMLTASGLSFALGAVAAWPPAMQVGRMSVIDAIRRPA